MNSKLNEILTKKCRSDKMLNPRMDYLNTTENIEVLPRIKYV